MKIARKNNQNENSGCSSSGQHIDDVSIDNSLPATTTCTRNDFVIPSEIFEPFDNMPSECSTSNQYVHSTCDEEYEVNFLPLCSAENNKCTNTNTYLRQASNIDDNPIKATTSKRNKPSSGKDKYYWQYHDTKLLISSYALHAQEQYHPVLRNHFWENIVNDLVSHGHNVDKDLCANKWNNLLRTYKTCKDKSGREPHKFAFWQEMDEVLGDKPTNSSSFTLGSLKKDSADRENDSASLNVSIDSLKKTDCKQTKKMAKEKGMKKRRKSNYESNEKIELMREKMAIEREKIAFKKSFAKDFFALEKTKTTLMGKYFDLKSKKD
ncbi:uncharacterized protein [Chelonus insularis]|nr:uncharacterized protein LOC118064039 isoform X2 [Chelonus insularis]XP_034945559.1 uncharacterized protein LOC118070842 isoform X2 [Chelonus insularis]